MDAPLRISLVLPAFNEAAVIARSVAEAEAELRHSFDDFEVLVVDDGSTDDSAAVVNEQLPFAPHARLIRHDGNRGYGAALRTGFEAARFPLVAFTDADCQFDLRELVALARLADEFDIVAGYRVNRKDTLRRRVYSRGYNLLARALLGTRVRDVDCALKVFRRSVLSSLMPESRGFFVNSEMLTKARRLGLTVTEQPVSHRPRLGGESKVSVWEIPKVFSRLVGFWWSHVVRGPKALPTVARVESWRSAVTRPESTRQNASPRPASSVVR